MSGRYCEDYPCCGHTPADPCWRMPYDEPGYFDDPRNRLASVEPGSPEWYEALEDMEALEDDGR